MVTEIPSAPTDSAQNHTGPGDAPPSVARLHLGRLAWSGLIALVPTAYLLGGTGAPAWGAGLLLAGLAAVALRRPSSGRDDATTALIIFQVGVSLWVLTSYSGQPNSGVGSAANVMAAAANVMAAAASVMAAAALLAAVPIRRLGNAFVPLVSRMPGLRPAPPELDLSRLGGRVSLVALGVGVVLGALTEAGVWRSELTAWAWLAMALAMTVSPRDLRRARRAADLGRSTDRADGRPRRSRVRPRVRALHLAARRRLVPGADVAALPAADRTAIRHRRPRPTMRPGRCASDRRSGGRGAAASPTWTTSSCRRLRAAFYVNASSGNGAFVRYKQLTHVYLGHGDSDKPPSYNPTHAMYDQIFAAGPAATERYAAHGVAHPAGEVPRSSDDLRSRRAAGRRPMRTVTTGSVLYAPTWRGTSTETMLYSLPVGERIVAALLRSRRDGDLPAAPVQLRLRRRRRRHRPDPGAARGRREATGRPHLLGAAAETDRGDHRLHQRAPTPWCPTSPAWSRTTCSRASRSPWWRCRSDPTDFVPEYPVARASYVVDGDLPTCERRAGRDAGCDPMAGRPARGSGRDYLGDFPAEGYAAGFVDAVRSTSSSDRAADVRRSDDDDRPTTGSGSDARCGCAASSPATAGTLDRRAGAGRWLRCWLAGSAASGPLGARPGRCRC